jgi:curved DNA-binding protein CbpA
MFRQYPTEPGGVMSESRDPYDVLGVTSAATPGQISHAFRAKLRALHPDTGYAGSRPPDDAQAQLRQLLRAYDALRRGGRRRADADQPSRSTANPTGPVKIPVTYRGAPTADHDLRPGPVRRHR